MDHVEKPTEHHAVERLNRIMSHGSIKWVVIVLVGVVASGSLIWVSRNYSDEDDGRSPDQITDELLAVDDRDDDESEDEETVEYVTKDYEVGDYIVTLEIPEGFVETDVQAYSGTVANFRAEAEFEIQPEGFPTQEFPENDHFIFSLSDTPVKVSYDNDPEPSYDENFDKIFIEGESYKVEHYNLGDGGPGGSSFEGNYLIELDTDLYASVYTTSEVSTTVCNSDCSSFPDGKCVEADCTLYDPETLYSYKTSNSSIEAAKAMIRTIKWRSTDELESDAGSKDGMKTFEIEIKNQTENHTMEYVSIAAPDSGEVVPSYADQYNLLRKYVDGDFEILFGTPPYYEFPEAIDEAVSINTQNFESLHRVSVNDDDVYYYTTQALTEDSRCAALEEGRDEKAPCLDGLPLVTLDSGAGSSYSGSILVRYEGDEPLRADEIVESIFFYKDSETL